MKKSNQQGITLIELMIVVAIIGILASIAIPAYQDYITRAKWGKTISAISAMKLAVGECLNDNSGLVASCAGGGANTVLVLNPYGITNVPSGTSVEGSTVTLQAAAVIRVVGSGALGGCQFDFTPTADTASGTIAWVPVATAPGALALAKCVTMVKGAS